MINMRLKETTRITITTTSGQTRETIPIREIRITVFRIVCYENSWGKKSDSFTPDPIANSINEFIYNPDDGITFQSYYRRYKASSKSIVHIGITKGKLFTVVYEKYLNFI